MFNAKWKGGTFMIDEFPKYYNYDYQKEEYYEVDHPYHDHYHFVYEENAWYEDLLMEDDLK